MSNEQDTDAIAQIRAAYDAYVTLMRKVQPYGPQMPADQATYRYLRDAMPGYVGDLLAALDRANAEIELLKEAKFGSRWQIRGRELTDEELREVKAIYPDRDIKAQEPDSRAKLLRENDGLEDGEQK